MYVGYVASGRRADTRGMPFAGVMSGKIILEATLCTCPLTTTLGILYDKMELGSRFEPSVRSQSVEFIRPSRARRPFSVKARARAVSRR